MALGDSVTSGYNCRCTAFPDLYAEDLSRVRGVPTTMINAGVAGEDSTQLRAALGDPASPEGRAAAAADIDVVTIGANDFADQHDPVTAGRCAGHDSDACVRDELVGLRTNLAAILTGIRDRRHGQPTALLVTGYWNVFEDGAVARSAFPETGLAATHTLTLGANRAIAAAAHEVGARYVDLYPAFHGPAGAGDVTSLLAPDGDHPDAEGHRVIARRLVAAGLPGLVTG